MIRLWSQALFKHTNYNFNAIIQIIYLSFCKAQQRWDRWEQGKSEKIPSKGGTTENIFLERHMKRKTERPALLLYHWWRAASGNLKLLSPPAAG